MRAVRALLPFLALTALATAGTTLRAETLEEVFHRGNTAYEQGRWEEAARAYRNILRYRIKSPVVEYNLANAEFKLNNLGPAILHYRRALRLEPTDAEILSNLAYARSFCQDRVEVPQQAAVIRGLRAVQNRLGSWRQAWLALGLLWAAAGVVASSRRLERSLRVASRGLAPGGDALVDFRSRHLETDRRAASGGGPK